MNFDLIFRQAGVGGPDEALVDIGGIGGRIAEVEPKLAGAGPASLGPTIGRLLIPA